MLIRKRLLISALFIFSQLPHGQLIQYGKLRGTGLVTQICAKCEVRGVLKLGTSHPAHFTFEKIETARAAEAAEILRQGFRYSKADPPVIPIQVVRRRMESMPIQTGGFHVSSQEPG